MDTGRISAFYGCMGLLVSLCAVSVAAAPLVRPPADLLDGVPPDFTRFEIEGHSQVAQSLNRFLWYHLAHRIDIGPVMFNKEYLSISDAWVNSPSFPQFGNRPAWKAIVDGLQQTKLHRSGYLLTHQHDSTAHDYGWPFPMWVQAGMTAQESIGKTAGWHFGRPDGTWVWASLAQPGMERFHGAGAAQSWILTDARSEGVDDGYWRITVTGKAPKLLSPHGISWEAFQAPFIQIRWKRTGAWKATLPRIEWMREGDTAFGPDRRVTFEYTSTLTPREQQIGGIVGDAYTHGDFQRCIVPMHTHPKWNGRIVAMRIVPGEPDKDAGCHINAVFTAYDTRHPINNPIFILATWRMYRWSGDLDFLRAQIDRMRMALRQQQTEFEALKRGHIRVTWQGHDALPGWSSKGERVREIHGGHGIGGNYWDILPFGWDEMYATQQYYAAVLAMAEAEEAIQQHREWNMPARIRPLDPAMLRRHAVQVRDVAQKRFWNEAAGRFVGCIDPKGTARDYGFVVMNQEAIWYDIASRTQARSIMDWISGKRIVEGDTSTGEDIYHWVFAPRSTTRRNVEWYSQGWYYPEDIPWGGQVQDGGAVLGFTFYDLWARLKVYGPDDAWQRLCAIMHWDNEAWKAGGYRAFYTDGSKGATLQGSGTAGGLGIDMEFHESSMLPAFLVYGLLGIDADAHALRVRPHLPVAVPSVGVANLWYRGARLNVRVSRGLVEVEAVSLPQSGILMCGPTGVVTSVDKPGTYRLR